MSVFDFKLALYGQAYNSEGLLYAYPESVVQLRNQGSFPAWVNALPSDARFLRALVTQGGECFSTKYCTDGIFYCYTKYNQFDSRNGAVSILLYTKSYVIGDAKHLVTVLRNLMTCFLGKQGSSDIKDSDVRGIIGEITKLYSVKSSSLSIKSPERDAYRIYQTEDDLQKYLSAVIQDEYAQYKWVHFIPALQKQPNIQPESYTELLTPVKKCYLIKKDDAISEYVLEGKQYSVTYKKSGFLLFEDKFIVGVPSLYVEMDEMANVIRIKSQSELDLKFKKRVIINLYDANTNAPIRMAGKQLCASYEVTENSPKKITLNVKGYQSKDFVVDPAKLASAENYSNESLKRIETYKEEDLAPENDDRIWVPKKALIRNFIVIALIALIVGVGISMTISHFVYKDRIANADNDTIVEKKYFKELEQGKVDLNSDKEKLLKENDSLKNQLQGKEREIKALEDELKKSSGQTGNNNGKSATGSVSQEEAKKKAKKYLNENVKWGLHAMRQAIGWDQAKLNRTKIEEYEFLKMVVDAGNLDENKINQIITNESFDNEKWKKIKDNINTKLTQNRSGKNRTNAIDGIKKAFKEANSENGKTNTYENGTVSLETLYKKLTSN